MPVDDDPDNCGGCNIYCSSGECRNARCVEARYRGGFGEACATGDDCFSGLCLGTGVCTSGCTGDCDCPPGHACVEAGSAARICFPGASTCMHSVDGGVPPAPTTDFPFTPSNAGCFAQGHALPERGGACDGGRADTDMGLMTCGSGYMFDVFRQPEGEGPAETVGVFFVRSLEVVAGERLVVIGSRPIIIVAREDVIVAGEIRVEYSGGYPAPDSEYPEYGNGPGGGGYSPRTTSFGGGGEGGDHCTTGGLGAEQTLAYGRTYGTTRIVPLVGGSSGGKPQSANRSGAGGGALQIVAGGSIVVQPTGSIVAAGEWGPGGVGEGSGGGAGGAILLEAPIVRVLGTLNADGGHGGTGVGGAGATGSSSAQNGMSDWGVYSTHGGGGGGAGRIRINTSSGAAEIAIDAVVSPATCFTQGLLEPRVACEPMPPYCPEVPPEPTRCNYCLAELCCEDLTQCEAELVCSGCRTSSMPGPACSSDPSLYAYQRCVSTNCPDACRDLIATF